MKSAWPFEGRLLSPLRLLWVMCLPGLPDQTLVKQGLYKSGLNMIMLQEAKIYRISF